MAASILYLLAIFILLFLAREIVSRLLNRRARQPPAKTDRVQDILAELKPVYDEASASHQLTPDPRFAEGAELLARERPPDQLLELLGSGNPIQSLMAGAALARLPFDDAHDEPPVALARRNRDPARLRAWARCHA